MGGGVLGGGIPSFVRPAVQGGEKMGQADGCAIELQD